MKTQHDNQALDSFDYCLQFWDGAIDDEEISHFVREASPRRVPEDDAV
jgi:hypothetical protein